MWPIDELLFHCSNVGGANVIECDFGERLLEVVDRLLVQEEERAQEAGVPCGWGLTGKLPVRRLERPEPGHLSV